MKLQKHIRPAGLIGALCMAGYAAIAGSVSYDFDTDPTGILQLYGTSTYQPADGNPASGGYLSVTDAANGQAGSIIFDDFDNGLVVKAFSFSMDVRIGGGTDDPADGFSINYARSSDPILVDGLSGWAASPTNEGSLPEEGTQTGLAIGFDAWYSGGDGSWNNTRLPGVAPLTDDVIGVSVRIDNQLVYHFAMPTKNGSLTDVTSLQTGPQDANNPGAPTLLGWAPLSVNLAEDGTLKISYKGVEVTPAGGLHTTFAPSPGRLVMGGRTGGANQNNHVDNIKITTIPATTPTIGVVSSKPDSFSFVITDAGPVKVTPTSVTLKLNGNTIAVTSADKVGSDTTVIASTAPTLIPPGSTNTVVASFKDGQNNTYTATRIFVEGQYAVVPASFALPSGAVDTSKGGFKIRSYQTDADNQNSLALTELELGGLLGPNLADLSQFGTDGFYTETGVINYDITPAKQGNFDGETLVPGFPGTGPGNGNDHAAMEILGYVNFPTAGTYTWGVSSDDGFRVSVAPSVGEKMNAVALGSFNGGRGAGIPGTLFSFYVSQPGFYPVRAIWENGGGGSNIELFSVKDDGTFVLVNDGATAGAIKFYQASSVILPYVASVSPEPGLFAENRTVNANSALKVVLVDGSSAKIDQGSIKLTLNGTPVTPVISTGGKSTTVSYDNSVNLLPVGTNTASITYAAGGAPVTQSWSFKVGGYATLDPSLSTPIGSGDPAHPGFRVKTVQVDVTSPTPGSAGANQLPNLVSVAEQTLLGLFGPNVADLSKFSGGYFSETGVINYDKDPAGDGQQGNFGNETLVPGIPGTLVYSGATDNYALEIQTYVEFPAAGFYTFGIASDDGFATYESTGPAPLHALNINSPSAIAGRMGAISAGSDEGGIAVPLPTTPITGKLVYAVPAIADRDLDNAAEVAGNIVLMDRGTVTFTAKLDRALKAGAKAVIMVNNRDETSGDGILPIVMGGTHVEIPAVMISIVEGRKLKEHLADAGGVNVSLGQDGTVKLGVANYGKGADTILFSFAVPQAGVYPLRTVNFEGGGGASIEIFSVANDGTRTLINDSAAGALKAFSAVKAVTPAPVLTPVAGLPGAQFSNVVLNNTTKTITADLPAGETSAGYFSIAPPVNITSVKLVNGKLVITFQ